MRRSRLVVAAGVLCVALALSACGGQKPGSAATLGDTRITEQQLASDVQEILVAQGLPADSSTAELTSQSLGRMITTDLVNMLAEREGVVISPTRLAEQTAAEEAQFGGREAMEQTYLSQDIPPSQIQTILLANLQAADLGAKLAPNVSPEEQIQAVIAALAELSDELQVTVSPRFGTWDALNRTVGPVPDDLSTLPNGLLAQ